MDLLGKNFLSSQKKAAITKSILWNVFVETFKKHKNIDITDKIVSVKKSETFFIITVNNPLIKQEFLFLEKEITDIFHMKLEKMWLKDERFIIKMK